MLLITINRRQGEIAGPVMTSADAREGATAFAEKRAPGWKGTLGPTGLVRSPSSRHDRARAAVIAVLAEVDPLPGTKREAPVRDGERERRPEQSRLDVRRHVVRALERVGPVRGPLGNGVVEPGLEVPQHLGGCVLVHRQAGRGVLD